MKRIMALGLFVFLTFQVTAAFAGEQGHYFPGVMNVRDVVQPPPGLYLANYNFAYQADKYNLSSGDELDQISVSGSFTRSLGIGRQSIDLTLTGTVNVDVDIELEMLIHQPTLIWVTEHKILGANYGLLVGQPFGNMKIKAAADISGAGSITLGPVSQAVAGSRHVEIEDEKFGLGDTMVSPFFLGWHGEMYDANFNYVFYAPTGDYDRDDLANIGMGFWTHQFQAAFVYYPLIIQPKATALTVVTTYEIHGDKDGADITPGDNFTLEYGLSQYLAPWLEIGAFGFNQWQVSDDSGADATSTVQDQTNGAGVQVSVWPIENKLNVSGRFYWEYGVEDRFEGWLAALNLTYIF